MLNNTREPNTNPDEPQLNIEAYKYAIAQIESAGGKYMWNNTSSATGKYQFLYDLIKKDPSMAGVSRREFMNRPELQESIMDKALSGKLTGFTYGSGYANKLRNEYKSNLDVNSMAALVHFLGPGNARKYLKDPSNFRVPGKVNATGQQYLDRFQKHFKKYVAENSPEQPVFKPEKSNVLDERKQAIVQRDCTYVASPRQYAMPQNNINSGFDGDTSESSSKDVYKDIENYKKRNEELNKFKTGGHMTGTSGVDQLVTLFEAGGTHEENPLGGIPQGVGANGKPNLVEEGETKWNDYIFSNAISLDGSYNTSRNKGNVFEDGGKLKDPPAKKEESTDDMILRLTSEIQPMKGLPKEIEAPSGFKNIIPKKKVPEKKNDSSWIDDFVDGADFKKPIQKVDEIKYNSGQGQAKSERLLKVGTKGDDVKSIQSALGIDSDGIYGRKTRQAVMDFQKANNLKVDGIVGKQTIEAINSANSGKYTDYKSDQSLVDAVTKSQGTTSNYRPRVKPVSAMKKVEEKKETNYDNELEVDGVKRRMDADGKLRQISTTELKEGFNNLVPSSARMLINDLGGRAWNNLFNDGDNSSENFSTITEENITKDQREILSTLSKSLLLDGKTAIGSYDDWRDKVNMAGESIEDGLNLDNQANTIAQVIGRANINVDESGNIFIKDQYNFNDAGKTYEELQKKRNMKPSEVGWSKAVYSIARNTGAVYGSGNGEGAKVSMLVGNINDMGLTKRQIKKIKKLYAKKS